MDIIRDFITDKENIAIADAARKAVATSLWRDDEEAQYQYTKDIIHFLKTQADCKTDEQALKIYKLSLLWGIYYDKLLREKINQLKSYIEYKNGTWVELKVVPDLLKCFYHTSSVIRGALCFNAVPITIIRTSDNKTCSVKLIMECRFPVYDGAIPELFNDTILAVELQIGDKKSEALAKINSFNAKYFDSLLNKLFQQFDKASSIDIFQ